jgi:hypothetical protein
MARTSTRWLAAAGAAVMLLLFVLVGTGSTAPGASLVRIADATAQNQVAHVDALGNLSVAGSMTLDSSTPINVAVDSSTPVSTTSADDPERRAFQFSGTGQSSALSETAPVSVPSGMRLVITSVSGSADLPAGQDLIEVDLGIISPHAGNVPFANPAIVPVHTGVDAFGDEHFIFAGETSLYADQDFNIGFVRNSDAGLAGFIFTITGYLIDCSVGAGCS